MKKHDVVNLIWGDLEANWHHGRWPRATILTIGHKDCVHLLLLGYIFRKKKRTFWGILTDQVHLLIYKAFQKIIFPWLLVHHTAIVISIACSICKRYRVETAAEYTLYSFYKSLMYDSKSKVCDQNSKIWSVKKLINFH